MKMFNAVARFIDEVFVGSIALLLFIVPSAILCLLFLFVSTLPWWIYTVVYVALAWWLGRLIDYHEYGIDNE